MKTLDEVIDYCEGKQTCGEWVGIADALLYLKLYRSDKLQWEREKDDMQSRYQEAIDNCEQAENRFKAALKRLDIGTLNNPLSWDELTEMKGKPVWVEIESDKRWEIVEKTGENGWAEGEWLETNDSLYRREEQGETWQAYRKERE